MIALDGRVMHVSSTAANGVVDTTTRMWFRQRGDRVWATYAGGRVRRGALIGRRDGDRLCIRYAQTEAGGDVHGGRSCCDLLQLLDGRVRIIEHFQWSTRSGDGVNVFDEPASPTDLSEVRSQAR